ncbi:nitroreductase [Sulfuriferula sp. AH1]|uniref:SagB family peptide dehydrogenase n=1 Tax=Sulfuriferula sp. AH1 TaxID=1985873 RepID=UPI000B3B6A08|nr:SagB family peptide dehydrogenase [Sulfuriferula sp. AH1]ARU30343.1 nitroreductase [Sulfuriferula sp. AH1]
MTATPDDIGRTQPAAGADSSLTKIVAYHQRSKHRLERYAAGPETLDWSAQPNPFREFSGAPRIRLPMIADRLTASFAALHTPGAVAAQPLTLDHVAAMLELAFGLSAWKEYGPDRWAVRCNPSSGNLHPTEAYVISRDISELEDGVYHYLSRDHALERRCRITAAAPAAQPGLLVGISSITWREAWKYGERAFRYCQLDTGHAIGALRYAAAVLGWHVRIADAVSQQQLAEWLGLDRDANFPRAEREEAELLLEITIAPDADTTASWLRNSTQTDWRGQANILDAHPMYRWPIIDDIAAASRKPATQPAMYRPETSALASTCSMAAATLIRQRRSAQRFDARFTQDADSFYTMLTALLPDSGTPWDVWNEVPRVHPVLFVHRIDGLAPGIYALPRSADAQARMQATMRTDFLWRKPDGCPEPLPLYLLAKANLGKALRTISCHQAIAADSTFTLAILAEFDTALHNAPWRYRQLYWEAGLFGQVLYLQAEAASLRGTGIGCYFDDTCHELLGLQDTTFQSMYHFTVGYPLTDERIANLPPYPRT